MQAKSKKTKITPEIRKHFQELSLMNNYFMNLVLEDNIPCVEEILRVIINKPDLKVKSTRTQKMLQGLERSIYLDVFAEDSEGVLYNIEIQQADEGADPRRARFHGGMIDVHSLKAGRDFKELPECYVIFITKNDVLGLNKTIYTIHRYIDGTSKQFYDGSHVIYVNTSAKDDGTEIWKLIHDLRCTNADEMFFPRLAARVNFLKGAEKGEVKMGDYFDDLFAQWRKEAAEEGRKEAVEEVRKKAAKAAKEAERKAAKEAEKARKEAAKEAEKKIKAAEKKAAKEAEKAAEKKAQQKAKQEKENVALKLIRLGKLTIEEIAESSGLTLKRVQALAATL